MTKNSKFYIKYENSLQYEYTSEKKYSFTDFMSNIGGLFGLWFGISFVDMSQFIGVISTKIKQIILLYIDFNKVLAVLEKFKTWYMVKFITNCVKKFRILIVHVDIVNWKNVMKMITLPLMLFQIWVLTDDYLNYPMDVSVQWFPYRDSLNILSEESIPSITVCYEHIFDRLLFDENFKASFIYNFNLSFYNKKSERTKIIENETHSNDKYIQNVIRFYYYRINGFFGQIPIQETLLYNIDVNNRTEFIERQFRMNDKTLNDFNLIEKQLDFFTYIIYCDLGKEFRDFFNINYEEDFENICVRFRRVFYILSPYGKCHTFLSKIYHVEKELELEKILSQNILNIGESRFSEGTSQNIRYYKKKFFIHSSKELPISSTYKFELTDISVLQKKSFKIMYNRIDFKKLPKPYETNCYNYGESNRFECLNECYFNGYQLKWNCTPNDNHLLTLILRNNIVKPRVKFCHKTNNETLLFNNYIREHCYKNCLESCEQIHFYISKIEVVQTYFNSPELIFLGHKFIIKDKFYQKIIFDPRITFIDLIIGITNILSLWHGISFLSILSQLLIILMIYFSNINILVNQNFSLIISKVTSCFKVIIQLYYLL